VFNARPEEGKSVYLLLLLGFSIGLFLATYDVAAPAIFLNKYHDDNILAQAFLVSGAIGLLATFLYSYLQARIPFSTLVVSYMILMLLATIFVWHQSSQETPDDAVVFIAFVMALPFSYISLLMFWGYFGRMFNLKQSKRVIGGIDTGQLIASIIALFAIGYVLDNNFIITVDLYLGSMVGLAGMILTSLVINTSVEMTSKREGDVSERTMPLTQLFSNKYTKFMVVFVVISLICITFVDYSFLKVTNAQWVTEAEKASFLAKFEAAVVLFSFLFQTFVTDWVISNYGLRVSLLINPVLSLLLIVIAIFTGLAMGYINDNTGDFLWFFLAIAATKLFIDSLKDALDGPSFKLYFLPIDANIKFDVSTKVEGFVTALGGLLAGGILILMNTFNLDLIYVVYGAVPILAGWFVVTNKMHSGYIGTLQSTLEQTKIKQTTEHHPEHSINVSRSEDSVINSLMLLECTEPGIFEKTIIDLADNSKGKVKEYIQHKIDELDLKFSEKEGLRISGNEIKELASSAADMANTDEMLSVSADQLYNLAKSSRINDRLLSVKLLRSLINDTNIFVLLELLRDQKAEVKKQAIITARKVKRKETWPLLLELLNNKVFTFEASAALVESGTEVLPSLENAFHRSGQSQDVMLKIVRIMSRIGGPEANDHLWSKVDFHDRKIVRQILQSFADKKYQTSEHEASLLMDILDVEIGKAIWNMSAETEISDQPYNRLLIQALKDELNSNFDFIYIILSLIYDPESILLVKENIEAGTSDGNAYALELLDIFLAPDLKPKLYPLLDDIEVSEKLEKLQVFYPRQSYEEKDTYNYLLNREITAVNRWTKACTLYSISQNKNFKVNESIIAHMFNPDMMIAELATSFTYKNNPGNFDVLEQRMRSSNLRLGGVINRVKNNLPTIFAQTLELSKQPFFKNFNGLLISQLVDKMEQVDLSPGDESGLLEDRDIYILISGNVQLQNPSQQQTMSITANAVFGISFFETQNYGWRIRAQEHAVLLKLNINDMFDVLTNYPELARHFMYEMNNSFLKRDKIVSN
jgi:hypothetical protein